MKMEPLNTILDRSTGQDCLPPNVAELYGGPLRLPEAPEGRPWTMVNFVTTLEGITSFALPGKAGGGNISGFNPQDQFIMGLLRSISDAVVVGANTLRTEPEHLWTPEFISSEHQGMFSKLRQKLGKKSANPLNMFVTGSGKVLPGGPDQPLPVVFRTEGVESVIITTEQGKITVEKEFRGRAKPTILTFGQDQTVNLAAMMRHLRTQLGIETLLVEGGSGFNGAIIDAGLYDELYLTRAPQIVGTLKAPHRPLFVSGFERTPEKAIWHDLVSVKESGHYLYLRYGRR